MDTKAFVLNDLVPALRSGEYKQTNYSLNLNNKYFCCLGVACDLLINQGLLPAWAEAKEGMPEFDVAGEMGIPLEAPDEMTERTLETKYLPAQAAKLLGWYHEGPEILFDGEEYSLADANDNSYTFKEIADGLVRLYGDDD